MCRDSDLLFMANNSLVWCALTIYSIQPDISSNGPTLSVQARVSGPTTDCRVRSLPEHLEQAAKQGKHTALGVRRHSQLA